MRKLIAAVITIAVLIVGAVAASSIRGRFREVVDAPWQRTPAPRSTSTTPI